MNSKSRSSSPKIALLAAAVVVVLFAWSWLRGSAAGELPANAFFTVHRTNMLVSVTEDGALKAVSEVSVRSNLEGLTRIIKLAPEGAYVQEGDLLVELDSSELRDRINAQEINLQDALFTYLQAEEGLKIQKSVVESNVKAAELKAELAQSDLEKYRDGDAPQRLKNLEGSIQILEDDLRTSKDRMLRTEVLVKMGHASRSESEADALSFKRRQIQMEQNTESLRMMIKFDQPNQLRQLESNLQQAKDELIRLKQRSTAEIAQVEADLRTAKSSLDVMEVTLNQQKKQLDFAKIRAPQEGLVVYAAVNQSGRGQGRGEEFGLQQRGRGRGDGGGGRGGFGGQGGGGDFGGVRGRRERGQRGGGGGSGGGRNSGGGSSLSSGQGSSVGGGGQSAASGGSSLGSAASAGTTTRNQNSSLGSSTRTTSSSGSGASGQSSSIGSSSPSSASSGLGSSLSSSSSSLGGSGSSLSSSGSSLSGLSQISYVNMDASLSSRSSSSSSALLNFDQGPAGRQNAMIEEGAIVRQRQELIKLPDISQMLADVKIPESRVSQVRRGMTAYVKIDTLPGRQFKGTVRRVGAFPDAQAAWLNPNSRVYATDVLIEDELPLMKPGVSARAEIIITNLPSVLLVPIQSVTRREGQQVCYVQSRKGPAPVPVTVGWFNDQFIEVSSGLKEGDRVLLAPPAESKTAASSESGTATNQVKSTNGTARPNGSIGGERGTRGNGR